jgi:hypothetical protein
VCRDKIASRKPEGKRPLGRWRRKWENGIKTVLTETVWECELDSAGAGQD